jgi:hypothetical protein
VTPTSLVRRRVPCRCRCRSSPPGSSSWSRPAEPGTAPGGPACASNRTPPASGPRTDAQAARSSPSPEGPRRGQCVAYSFDEISHTDLMDRVRDRIGGQAFLGLVKAFLKAGILSEDGGERDTVTGTPQGGILSPPAGQHRSLAAQRAFRRGVGVGGRLQCRSRRRHKGTPRTASCDTQTISSSWWPAPERMPGRCGTKWQRCFARSAYTCPRRRRRSPTSTRASSSWASASSGKARGARTSGSSTPGRRRRRSPPSRPRCGRSPEDARTNRSQSCCAD